MATGAFATAAARAFDFQPIYTMDEYLTELVSQGRSDSYVRGIRNGLHHFAEFLRSEGVTHPEEITRLHIVRFQAYLNARVTSGEWTKSTSIQNQKRARAWVLWLVNCQYITDNPWTNIRVGKVVKQPNPLSDDDMDRLFFEHQRGAFQEDPFKFHRRDIILTLLYAWGLRIHELEALTVGAMNPMLDFVVARNKGGGTKTLPYTPEVKKAFRRWDAVRSKHAVPGVDALLINTTGTQFTKEHIRQLISDLGKAAGVAVNPHRLRDTCGTHMLDDNVPVERVQQVLGHAQLGQTLQYARVNNKAVYRSVETAMDPRLRMFQNTRELRTDQE